jgi:hypothetical protein
MNMRIGVNSLAFAAALAAGALAPMLAGAPDARAAEGLTPIVRGALERALALPGARIDGGAEERSSSSPSSSSARQAGCQVGDAEVLGSVEGSGRIAVKLIGQRPGGQPCEVWTWVRVRVMAPLPVSTRALRAGDPVAEAYVTEERELRAGHAPPRIGPQAVATRAIAAGQVLQSDQVGDPSVRLGQGLKVLVVSGALTIEQSGRSVPCARGRTCAVLASGARVEGELIDGRLVVQPQ